MALVISIIVLLILATVSINLVINNGILDKAKSAVDKYSDGKIEEQIKLAYQEYQMAHFTSKIENIEDYIRSILNTTYGDNVIENVSKSGNSFMVTFLDGRIYTYNISKGKAIDLTNTTNISKDQDVNFVRYYADMDADGTVDGVIFADLLAGSIQETQQWGNKNGTYTIPKISADSLKDYYVSQKNYDGTFGTNDVISPKGSGSDRFYIMSLTDFTSGSYTTFYWYKNAIGKMKTKVTSNGFGEGKENTRKMIEKWNASGTSDGYIDSAQDNQDIWNNIQSKYKDGWFLPSNEEWVAFSNELGIIGKRDGNYKSTYNLSDYYWTSYQQDAYNDWYISFLGNSLDTGHGVLYLRLATTF